MSTREQWRHLRRYLLDHPPHPHDAPMGQSDACCLWGYCKVTINRRAFLVGLGTASGGTLVRAQQKRHRIGIIGLSPQADLAGPNPAISAQQAFLRGLRELGYVYGEHFVTEVRGSGGKQELMSVFAAELVAAKVDVIVATGAAVPALKQATATIPIVMAATSDPVSQGLVQSLARPGGNITGMSLQAIETTSKRMELARELVPGDAPIAVVWNAQTYWRAAQEAARQGDWKLVSLEVHEFAEFGSALQSAVEARAGAIVVLGAAVMYPNRQRVAQMIAAAQLPAVYELREYVEAGGLLSYGPDIDDVWFRAAWYVDKILKGAKPADLPIEQPVKFETVINNKTARTLGLTIPASLLVRVDEVIE
jgi:putative tryptophan/tyrosine transport system substrate-binding protein